MKTLDWMLLLAIAFCLVCALAGCGAVPGTAAVVTDNAINDGKTNADTAAKANQALLCATTAGAAFRHYQSAEDWAAFERLCKPSKAP